ncbi:MAG: PAS domain-containing protein [Burkholderiales bacterium]|nr:PAS domain-containing protein [Burkholderiales bacterium]MBH2016156.1 PAS domain-containing protein [Burkholderiales bacterium]
MKQIHSGQVASAALPRPVATPASSPDDAALLGVIVALVRQATQVDLSHYKDSTFRRQLQRRMLELGVPDLDAYVGRLQQDPAELQRLQRSLLISVTRFFRDPEVFERLQKALDELVSVRADSEGLRLWVPGCATGEEAYTIAVLVAEALGERLARCPVRLFATDIDTDAIAHARHAVYPHAALEGVPAELVARHFSVDEDGVRPARHIRDMCVFAQHDLLIQPPFVNLDVVSCRNVLIYFEPAAQAEILARFHHALRPQGWLLLGQSESVGALSDLFLGVDGHVRLFRRGAASSPRLQELQLGWRQPLHAAPRRAAEPMALPATEQRFHQHLLATHALPSVMVDVHGRILHLWGEVDRYLKLEGGRADFTLAGLCLPALRAEVRTLLHLATTAAPSALSSQPIDLPLAQGAGRVRLHAQALCSGFGEVQGVAVGFESLAAPAVGPAPSGELGPGPTQADRQAWQEELAVSREHLHAMVQQLERANEDRQSLHEELQASSEELQSSNEELQASNEELTTLNEQLLAKSDELIDLNDTLLSIESSMQMALVVVDAQLRVRRFNPLAVRIFGLLEHDVGRSLASVPCSLPLDSLPRQIGEVLRTGEAQVARVDQDDRHYLMQLSPLRDAQGQLHGAILTFTDVAELRHAEVERSRLAAIVMHSQDAVIGKTLQGVITSWNPAAERLFGYTAQEAVGQPMLMVFPPELRDEEGMLLARIARGEVVRSFDTQRVRKDGQRIAVSVTLSPIRDGKGQVIGVSKIARDIGERIALDQARRAAHDRLEQLVVERTRDLADKERHLQSILDGMPGMVAYWEVGEVGAVGELGDVGGPAQPDALRLRFANRVHRETLGHEAQPARPLSLDAVLSDELYGQMSPHIQQALCGQACSFECTALPLTDAAVARTWQVSLVPDLADDRVRGFILMGFDVSGLKRAEVAAEAANRAKSDFLANMSHEIRTPLNAVLGLAQIAERQHEGEPVAHTFGHIVQAGQHLLGIINDILDFSKIEAGKLELQLARVDVTELIDRAVSMVSGQARSKGLSLRVSRDPLLAEAYVGDPVRLAQLLINLMTNAVKFTDAGRVELLISEGQPDGLSLVVSDTGCGMGPAVLQRLFKPFEQGDGSSTRRVGGTGLGLSICKRLVELMQGRIQVHSEPGQGSRFEVWLPLRPLWTQVVAGGTAGVVPLHGAARGALGARHPRLSGLRVLVAEDHPINQMVLRQLLEAEGASLVLVENGLQAVEAVEAVSQADPSGGAQGFDVVLCDVEMPVMDGYEATRRMRERAPALPIIGLTAHAFEDARRRGEAAGMSGYLTKPYMIDELVTLTSRLAAQHAQAAQRAPAASDSTGATVPGAPSLPPQEPLVLRLHEAALLSHYRTVPDFVPRLLSLVRADCVSQPQRLRAAVEARDVEALRQLAHGLVGLAGNVLLPSLAEIAQRVQREAEAGRIDEAATCSLCEALEALHCGLST